MRRRIHTAFWLGAALCLSLASAHAGESVTIPFVRYEANTKHMPGGEKNGWTTRFQNGAPEEQGQVHDQGFLQGELFIPAGEGPFPYVVLMHGCGGMETTARKWAAMWTVFFAQLKVGTLVLDSFGNRRIRSTCGHPDSYWARRRVDDAYSALDFLVARPEAKSDQIYVLGRSNGGRVVLNALQAEYRAARRHLFAGGVSLYGNCESRKHDDFYAPLLLLVAEFDDANPALHCRDLAAEKRSGAHPEIRLVVYPGAFHGFDDGSPFRMFMGWRMGGNAPAATDAKRQVRDFLSRQTLQARP